MCKSALRPLTAVFTCPFQSVEPIILSVGEEEEVSIRTVAELIAKHMGLPADRMKWDTSKPDGQHKKTASNEKLRTFLPEFKFKAIDDGIRESCEWFKANYDTARTGKV